MKYEKFCEEQSVTIESIKEGVYDCMA